jgi:hypothetical protein
MTHEPSDGSRGKMDRDFIGQTALRGEIAFLSSWRS